MGRDARASPAGTEGDASRADEPRRRDRSPSRRPRGRADRDASPRRARHAHGRPLRPAHERADRGQDRIGARGRVMLFVKDASKENIVVRGARVIDPGEGVDAVLDVRVDDGEGLVLAPAFVDPHVHLRTPGREDEETIASGTAAAAAGGYCAILAMPNTDPVVDSTDVLRGLRARAAEEAEVPVGFTAAITMGQAGRQL